jgi:mannosyltransferase OCH1-like enzyme
MKRFYPEFEQAYWSDILSNVQRADLARVLYLHQYSGLYADIDYEAKSNVFESLPKTSKSSFCALFSFIDWGIVFCRSKNVCGTIAHFDERSDAEFAHDFPGAQAAVLV